MESLRYRCTGHWPVHLFEEKRSSRGGADFQRGGLACARAGGGAIGAGYRSRGGGAPADRAKRRRFLQGAQRRSAVAFAGGGRCGATSSSRSSTLQASMASILPSTNVPALQAELAAARARHKRKDIERADEALSEAFSPMSTILRTDPGVGITWVDPQLRPAQPSALAALARRHPLRRHFLTMCRRWGGCTLSTASFATPSASTNIATTSSARSSS